MLDENLPTFFIKPHTENDLASTIYLTQHGSELHPEYSLRRPDPSSSAAKNCYAVALCDSYNPEVLYAEVLVRPEWTQPSLSAAEIRAQHGVPPPPVPVVPDAFVVQLYNPDQQVTVRQVAGTWNTSAYWEFEMPQHTFRMPSASALDRSQNDPAVAETTPKVTFKWKRDGKLSRDLTCLLAGKSTDGRRSKEADITIAMFKGGKEITLYQPNLHRVEVEDTKGLEVVLLLGAVVIRDIFFNASKDMFNISSPPATTRKNSAGILAGTTAASPNAVVTDPFPPAPPVVSQPQPSHASHSRPTPPNRKYPPPPPTDARTQWEIDAETARLKALLATEAAERERADRHEQRRIKKMLETEEKERRRRDADVAKETERLRKLYGVPDEEEGRRVRFASPQAQAQAPAMPPRPPVAGQMSQHHSAPHARPVPVARPQSTPQNLAAGPTGCPTLNGWLNGHGASSSSSSSSRTQPASGPYLQASGQGGSASLSGFFGAGGSGRGEREERRRMVKKRSVHF